MIWHSDSTTDILAAFGSNVHSGLSSAQVEWRLREAADDRDRLPRRARFGRTLVRMLFPPVVVIALLLCLFAAFLAVYNTARGTPQSPLPAILTAVGVLLTILLRAMISVRAHRSLLQLGKRGAPSVRVLRDGVVQQLSANELIPGDILHIGVGDFVAADCRLLSSEWLICDETVLSGEAHVVKDAAAVLSPIVALPERRNMLYAGSTVLSGTATAVAVEVGDHTEQRKLAPKVAFTAQALLAKITAVTKPLTYSFSLLCIVLTVAALLCGADVTEAVLCGALLLTLTAGALPTLVLAIWAAGLKHNEAQGISIHHEAIVSTLASADTIVAGKSAFLAPEEPSLVCGYAGDKKFDLRAVAPGEGAMALLRLAALCVEDSAASALDRAILACAEQHGMPSALLRETFPAIAVLPPDAEQKRMLSIHLIGGEKVLIVKGAPTQLLPLCGDVGSAVETASQLGKQGMQVLAVAYRYLDDVPTDLTSADIVQSLRFAGLLGFACAVPKRSVIGVAACRAAGIEPVLLTGDSRETAAAVAQKLGLISSADTDPLPDCVQPEQQSALSCALLSHRKEQGKTSVVCSKHSVSLLKAASVACTTEDAPPMLKGAADVVLEDNSFASLCRAVSLCRGLFGRIAAGCRLWYTDLFALLLTLGGTLMLQRSWLSAPALCFLLLLGSTLPLLLLFGHGTGNRFPKVAKPSLTRLSILLPAIWRGAITALGCIAAGMIGKALGNADAFLFCALGFGFVWQAIGAFLSPAALRNRRKAWLPIAAFLLLFGCCIVTPLLLSFLGTLLGLQPLSPIALAAAIGISLMAALISSLPKFFSRQH